MIRRNVGEGYQQKEHKGKGTLVSSFNAISGHEDETSTGRLLGIQQEVLRESRKVSVNISRKGVTVDKDLVVREDKFLNEKLLDNEKKINIEQEHGSKKDNVVSSVSQIKMISVALSKEDTDFISRGGGNVIRKIEQITGAKIERSGHGSVNVRARIRGSEGAVMKAKNFIKNEEVILNQGQVTFFLWNGGKSGKRMKKIEKDSNALIIIKRKFGDDMRPVTFIGTDLAITIAKAILKDAALIQTKIMLDSEVALLLRGGGKFIARIQQEAEVGVEIQGKKGDKGRAVHVIGSKEAVAKAWAILEEAPLIQTKFILDSEVGFLLRGGGKLINQIQKEAEVDVQFQGKRDNRGRAVDVIGTKEAVAKAWAMIQIALNKLGK